MHIGIVDIALIVFGTFFIVLGILLFAGKNGWAKRKVLLGNFEMNHELLGFICFLFGIILLLCYIIPALGPRLSSPGLS